MLQNIMTAMRFKNNYSTDDSTNGFASRRVHPRRSCDQCVGFVNGKAYPVLDWSPGGLRIFADTRPMIIGEEMDVELKFHLRDKLISVKHRASIVRKTNESLSLQFLPISSDMHKTFQTVIDDFNTREFAGSQA